MARKQAAPLFCKEIVIKDLDLIVIGENVMEMDAYYQKLSSFSLLNARFVFIDTEDYLADSLFIRHQVRVYFGDEFANPSNPYCAIFCHVRRWDEKRFRAAMEKLPNRMLLCGHTDYLDACRRLWSGTDKGSDSCGTDGAAEQAE